MTQSEKLAKVRCAVLRHDYDPKCLGFVPACYTFQQAYRSRLSLMRWSLHHRSKFNLQQDFDDLRVLFGMEPVGGHIQAGKPRANP